MNVRRPLLLALFTGALGVQAIEPPALESGLALDTFDRSVRPQDDLFRFVNGRWLDTAEMPADRVSYGTFVELADKVEADIRAAIEAAAADPQGRKSSNERKVLDLYASLMDEARIEALGLEPIEAELDRIDRIETFDDLASTIGDVSATGGGGPFTGSVDVDATDPRKVIVRVAEGGTLLPERDDYLSPEARFADVRNAYERYLRTVFTLIGRRDPASDARDVLALETALARIQAPRAAARPQATTANTFTLSRLPREMPGFNWERWARPQGIQPSHYIILNRPSFFRDFAALVPTLPLDTWKAWLAARYVTAAAPFLSAAFGDARFELFGRLLTGQERAFARWKRGVSLVNGYLGDAVGRLYVRAQFPESAKARTGTIVRHIIDAFRQEVERSAWMTGPAKKDALARLSTISTRIGYPDRWPSYGGLEIKAADLFGNVRRAQQFENTRRMARLRGPMDPGEWFITPQTVNAYYSPGLNQIVVPAAMLQPPLFTLGAEDAVNYGGLGAIVAHEIAHGLDQEQELQQRGRMLVEQFNAFSPLERLHVDGERTLRENVADLAGLSIAARAYELSLGGRPSPLIDGFTGGQRVFLGWARVWRMKERDAYLRQWLLTSPYAPYRYRANGTVSNLPAFYEAFGVKPGDRLYRDPDKQVRIW